MEILSSSIESKANLYKVFTASNSSPLTYADKTGYAIKNLSMSVNNIKVQSRLGVYIIMKYIEIEIFCAALLLNLCF